MPEFRTVRERDARDAIGGFVYQVQVTILRWLALAPDERLELERGEDIDLIQAAVGDGNPQRIMEQLKVRARGLTLRTPEALEAMANYHEHRFTNPAWVIRFRFITTAQIGLERPPLFSDKTTGIGAWREATVVSPDL